MHETLVNACITQALTNGGDNFTFADLTRAINSNTPRQPESFRLMIRGLCATKLGWC